MYWHFEQRRKIRNAEHRREKQEALMSLLNKVRKQKTDDNDNKTEEI
jgi:hypothetical protein